jgi:hypothetical protein
MTEQTVNEKRAPRFRAKRPRNENLGEIVKRVLAENDYNSKDAADELALLAKEDIDLSDKLVTLGAEQAIRSFYTGERRSAMTTPVPTIDDPVEAASRQAAKQERRLFWDRYALFGQISLRSAKQLDLRDSVNKRRQQAKGNLQCAAFEEDIMKRMKDRKVTVGQTFAISKIIEIAKAHHVIK